MLTTNLLGARCRWENEKRNTQIGVIRALWVCASIGDSCGRIMCAVARDGVGFREVIVMSLENLEIESVLTLQTVTR